MKRRDFLKTVTAGIGLAAMSDMARILPKVSAQEVTSPEDIDPYGYLDGLMVELTDRYKMSSPTELLIGPVRADIRSFLGVEFGPVASEQNPLFANIIMYENFEFISEQSLQWIVTEFVLTRNISKSEEEIKQEIKTIYSQLRTIVASAYYLGGGMYHNFRGSIGNNQLVAELLLLKARADMEVADVNMDESVKAVLRDSANLTLGRALLTKLVVNQKNLIVDSGYDVTHEGQYDFEDFEDELAFNPESIHSFLLPNGNDPTNWLRENYFGTYHYLQNGGESPANSRFIDRTTFFSHLMQLFQDRGLVGATEAEFFQSFTENRTQVLLHLAESTPYATSLLELQNIEGIFASHTFAKGQNFFTDWQGEDLLNIADVQAYNSWGPGMRALYLASYIMVDIPKNVVGVLIADSIPNTVEELEDNFELARNEHEELSALNLFLVSYFLLGEYHSDTYKEVSLLGLANLITGWGFDFVIEAELASSTPSSLSNLQNDFYAYISGKLLISGDTVESERPVVEPLVSENLGAVRDSIGVLNTYYPFYLKKVHAVTSGTGFDPLGRQLFWSLHPQYYSYTESTLLHEGLHAYDPFQLIENILNGVLKPLDYVYHLAIRQRVLQTLASELSEEEYMQIFVDNQRYYYEDLDFNAFIVQLVNLGEIDRASADSLLNSDSHTAQGYGDLYGFLTKICFGIRNSYLGVGRIDLRQKIESLTEDEKISISSFVARFLQLAYYQNHFHRFMGNDVQGITEMTLLQTSSGQITLPTGITRVSLVTQLLHELLVSENSLHEILNKPGLGLLKDYMLGYFAPGSSFQLGDGQVLTNDSATLGYMLRIMHYVRAEQGSVERVYMPSVTMTAFKLSFYAGFFGSDTWWRMREESQIPIQWNVSIAQGIAHDFAALFNAVQQQIITPEEYDYIFTKIVELIGKDVAANACVLMIRGLRESAPEDTSSITPLELLLNTFNGI